MNTRKEIKEWFQVYLLVIFIILPIVSVFVQGLVNIDKGFFVMYLVHSIMGTLMLLVTILFLLLRGACNDKQ